MIRHTEDGFDLTDCGGCVIAPACGLTGALRDKEELVEQFKSHNAILRNSLNYLPAAIADLKTELAGVAGSAPLDATLNALLIDTLRYNLAADPALRARIIR